MTEADMDFDEIFPVFPKDFNPSPKPMKLTKTQKLKLKKQKARLKKSKSPSKLKKQCDVLFSKIIRLRDGACLRCGKTEGLACAHIASRKHLAGRWDERNAITLCYRCHIFWAHREPLMFTEWLKLVENEKYRFAFTVPALLLDAINYEVLLDQLKERLAELEGIRK